MYRKAVAVELSESEFAFLYHRWRLEYNRARTITEKLLPQIMCYCKLLPITVFTAEIKNRIITLLQEGDVDELKQILSELQPQYEITLRKVISQREKTSVMYPRKEHHAL